jgi:O-antigen/teichoic acid export membrane protein
VAGKKIIERELKDIFKNKIGSNLFSLTSAEIAKRLLGFFTIVYLGRILDKSGFGIIGFATAFISYFILMVNFGFSTYGTTEIAKDQTKTSVFVNNVFSLRMLISVFLTFTLIIYLLLSEKSVETKYVFLITGLSLFTNAIALNWVFQAIEKMQYIAVRQILAGLLSLIGVFVFVHSKSDILIAAMILSLSALIGNIWFIPIYQKMFSKIKLEFNLPFWWELIKKSFPLAFASIMIGIYYNLDMVMLGYMKPESDVGIYNAAYKIFLVGILPFQLIFSAFFPLLSRVGLIDTSEFRTTLKNYAKFMFGTGIVSGIILFTLSDKIIIIVFGENYIAAAQPLSILAVNALMVCINVFFGNPMMAWGKNKEYAVAITFGAVANIILNFILIPEYSYLGAALATLLSEVAVFIGLIYFFNKFTSGLFFKKIK